MDRWSDLCRSERIARKWFACAGLSGRSAQARVWPGGRVEPERLLIGRIGRAGSPVKQAQLDEGGRPSLPKCLPRAPKARRVYGATVDEQLP
jgi:hypothetical protein